MEKKRVKYWANKLEYRLQKREYHEKRKRKCTRKLIPWKQLKVSSKWFGNIARLPRSLSKEKRIVEDRK
jgi:hypothetical protein